MKHLVISGGAGSLGKIVSEFLSKTGYHVHILDIQKGDLATSDTLSFYKTNLLDSHSLNQTKTALKDFSLYGVINILGGFYWGHFEKTSLETLDKMLDLNIRATFIHTQTFLPQLNKETGGRIINIGARPAVQPTTGMSAYALSKAGVLSFTESLAEELKPTQVTVNAILPSVIDTLQNRTDMPDSNPNDWVTPHDIAHIITFLLAPESQAINGALIPVYHKA